MGKAIYVFNCSDQMDYLGLAQIFRGLAASGSWGCFDEFNRLLPSVLSVCSVQYKCVTDAIKAGVKRFIIQETEVALDPSNGAYITMNPGYIGRAELPEGLKALFRPITVVVPDLELICQNMLMAEGFVDAIDLARKFRTLYALCKDLLSAAKHYDWGLRAIKSVLVVAGGFKRAEPDMPENAILMRALRDFNLPKIAAEDLEVFGGLLSDLFPGINPERKRDMVFEGIINKAADELKMFPDEAYILKVVQLGELLAIRHCVFTMGPPGCGKSTTW
jgi:dynein heavy chain